MSLTKIIHLPKFDLKLERSEKITIEPFGENPHGPFEPKIEYRYTYLGYGLPMFGLTFISTVEPRNEAVDLLLKRTGKKLFKSTYKFSTELSKEEFLRLVKGSTDYASIKSPNHMFYLGERNEFVLVQV